MLVSQSTLLHQRAVQRYVDDKPRKHAPAVLGALHMHAPRWPGARESKALGARHFERARERERVRARAP
eukprot:551084-Alexandrium_andersonii.AAC.1